MKHQNTLLISTVVLGALAAGFALSAQDRFTVKVPGGLAFSEFRGYDSWEIISLSHNGDRLAVILGNPAMIAAYKSGIPENGKPFPDGARMAKIHWAAAKKEAYPGQPLVAGALHDVDFMVKDNKRFSTAGAGATARSNTTRLLIALGPATCRTSRLRAATRNAAPPATLS